jgi:hypothetical protein
MLMLITTCSSVNTIRKTNTNFAGKFYTIL